LKYWLATCLTLILTACGGAAAPAAPTAEQAAVAPSSAPTVAKPAASPSPSPSPSPRPTATTETQKATTVYVANTDGQGVYVRKTPVMADRVRAYPDGTPLTIAGDDVDGDGQHWHHVKTPDGVDGYVPAMYTVDTPP
jgi:hypothetical protein